MTATEYAAYLAGTATVRYMATCRKCATKHSIDMPEFEASSFLALTGDNTKAPHTVCKSCGAGIYSWGLNGWTVVRGKFSDKVKCNARCTDAKRADCECSCSGRNHGKGGL